MLNKAHISHYIEISCTHNLSYPQWNSLLASILLEYQRSWNSLYIWDPAEVLSAEITEEHTYRYVGVQSFENATDRPLQTHSVTGVITE